MALFSQNLHLTFFLELRRVENIQVEIERFRCVRNFGLDQSRIKIRNPRLVPAPMVGALRSVQCSFFLLGSLSPFLIDHDDRPSQGQLGRCPQTLQLMHKANFRRSPNARQKSRIVRMHDASRAFA